ncbi:hypothetical protein SASPL_113435 [Salvia splendens]|uniref:Uncharacterized protein n=1 Tax=Salvia splendens TaxID=180675 RepID=A0A8X8XYY3_SALSN|nr:hypothetical protein SASPL_113435 [Salvia splendens]
MLDQPPPQHWPSCWHPPSQHLSAAPLPASVSLPCNIDMRYGSDNVLLNIEESSIEPRSKTPRQKTALPTPTQSSPAIRRIKAANEGVTWFLKKDLVIDDVQNFKRNLEESLYKALEDSIHISTKFLEIENLFSSLKYLRYDIFVDVALGVKWIPVVGYKNLKVVVEIDKEIDAQTAAEKELRHSHEALRALTIVIDRGLHLGDVAVLDISVASIEQDESTAQSIQSAESKGFQLVTKDEDKALPAFLNSIAENFAKTPTEILHGQGFSRLLFATGIVMDITNLSSPYCNSRDKSMATLLIDGTGRIEFNGPYQIPSLPTHGLQDRKVGEILQKYFKKWTMSDLLIPIWSWLRPNIRVSVAHLHNSASIQEILLCLIRFKRDILVSTKPFELMKNLLLFLHSSEVEPQLRALI